MPDPLLAESTHTAPAPGVPAAPTGLRITMLPGELPRLDWDAAPGVQSWDVLDVLNTTDQLKETVTVPRSIRSALKPHDHRRYAVQARNAAGVSPLSNTVDVPADGGGRYPSDVIPNLALGTIMRPTGQQGHPDNGFLIGKDVPDVFYVHADGGVVFQAQCGGVHSPNSHFCRSEWRQMATAGSSSPMASWSSSGTHSMTCVLSLDRTELNGRKRIVGMQIHDDADDVCQLMLHETAGLVLAHADGSELEPIDPHYLDGTKITVTFAVAADTITVTYNGQQSAKIKVKGSGWYFKTGAYLQDDVPNYHATATATGKVTLYSLELTGGAS